MPEDGQKRGQKWAITPWMEQVGFPSQGKIRIFM